MKCVSSLPPPGRLLADFLMLIIIDSDDPETFKNAPVCLQLVGRTLEEEAVVRMTEIVDAALAAAK
jgi:hypothetical protein